MTKGKTITRS